MTPEQTAALRENVNLRYLDKLHGIAMEAGLRIAYQSVATNRLRGRLRPSQKPWLLWTSDGVFLVAFRTLELLERNLRARAGC